MYNSATMRFKLHHDEYGRLTPIEGGVDIPFKIKRVYYIYDVQPEVTRGYHSHRKLHQVLIALGGSVKIRLRTPESEQLIELNDPTEGLYIGPHVWREMSDFSPGAVLLVLASDKYDAGDYVRGFEEYVRQNPLTSHPSAMDNPAPA